MASQINTHLGLSERPPKGPRVHGKQIRTQRPHPKIVGLGRGGVRGARDLWLIQQHRHHQQLPSSHGNVTGSSTMFTSTPQPQNQQQYRRDEEQGAGTVFKLNAFY